MEIYNEICVILCLYVLMAMSDVQLEGTEQRNTISYLYVLFASFNLVKSVVGMIKDLIMEYIPSKLEKLYLKGKNSEMEKSFNKFVVDKEKMAYLYPKDTAIVQ